LVRLGTLRSTRDFDRVFQDGKFTVKDNLVMHFVSTGGEQVRFGFVLPVKVGKAHRRNLLRRRMKEILRAALPRIRPGHDIVFALRRDEEESFSELKEKMLYLLSNRELLARGAK
jgi:ribonuclease P protein component